MTGKVLAERQAWSLTQKIDHSIGTIEAFINRTGKIPYVSFSGGKDSTVLLDICRRFVNRDIKAVFDNTGNEFPEIVQFVRTVENVTIITPKLNIGQIIANNGFPLISKETAQGIRQAKTTKSERLRKIRLEGTNKDKGMVCGKIANKWQFLIKEPFMISEKCCDILKKRPFAKYQRETGELPIIGTMSSESRLRRRQYILRGGCNSWKENHLASYPLSIWTEADIWAYIHQFNIPICSLYSREDCKRTGCMFCGFGAHLEKRSRFAMLYDLHPKLYEVFMRYENNGITYREALRKIGILLPDEVRQLELNFTFDDETPNE